MSIATNPPPRAAKPRIEWMDAVRGLAICLVVFDHALYFAIQNSNHVPAAMVLLSESLNPIRMPAMVFLSGLLLSASMKKGTSAYVGGKVRRILYPYVVWSIIYITIWLLADPWTDTSHHPGEYLEIVYNPPGHLWFLHNLFFFYLLALAFRSVPRLLVSALALAVCAVIEPISLDMKRFFFLFAFFILGDWTVRQAATWQAIRTSRAALAVSVLLTLSLVPVAAFVGNLRYELASVPLVVAALVVMTGLGQLLCRTWVSRPLRFMGLNSLNIYVMHWMIISIVVTALNMVVSLPGIALLAIGLLAGLLGSVIGTFIINRFNMQWLMAMPESTATRARAAVAAQRQQG